MMKGDMPVPLDTRRPSFELPSSRRLAGATFLAAAAAAIVLVVAVLPAEYGLDPTGVGRTLGLYRPAATASAAELPAGAATGASGSLMKSDTPFRSDEMSLTLESGEGAEIKAVMNAGDRMVFSWTTEGGGVDVDMHGEVVGAPEGASRSYWKDEGQTSGHGAFEAPAAGNHGWFWQNLNDDPVTVTVRTSGFYRRLIRP
jgi:hypothetical protein